MCLQHDLRLAGIDPEALIRVSDRPMPTSVAALCDGRLEVAQLFEPYVSLVLRAGAGDILYAASTRGPTVYTTFLATREGILRNRMTFAAMVRATRRTLNWVAEHSGEELADVVAPFYPDVPRDILASSLRRYRDAGLWARTPDVSRQGFARLAASLKSGGFISHMHSYEDCVDQSLS
jgi:NitT/TauT family transport system substrate-binding protein